MTSKDDELNKTLEVTHERQCYTNEELSRLNDRAFPERGTYCPKCRNYIPAFAALDADTEERIRDTGLAAMVELRRLTGCNLIFAKIWAIHPKGPHPARLGPPCPYCGRPLFSEGTSQCIQCGWDWHDPANPVQHIVALHPDRARRLATDSR
jgi:hypothetical protein